MLLYLLQVFYTICYFISSLTYIILIPDISFLSKNTMKKNPAINTSPVMVPTIIPIPAIVPGGEAVELER